MNLSLFLAQESNYSMKQKGAFVLQAEYVTREPRVHLEFEGIVLEHWTLASQTQVALFIFKKWFSSSALRHEH